MTKKEIKYAQLHIGLMVKITKGEAKGYYGTIREYRGNNNWIVGFRGLFGEYALIKSDAIKQVEYKTTEVLKPIPKFICGNEEQ